MTLDYSSMYMAYYVEFIAFFSFNKIYKSSNNLTLYLIHWYSDPYHRLMKDHHVKRVLLIAYLLACGLALGIKKPKKDSKVTTSIKKVASYIQ